ncbi:MAG: hypothetical protein Ct9H300mP1_36510 [Planctomycetaceae bacterium]|nr:MAG: hypothetical protein Ct9H300mP1_36510 [Planctomycetaceae bacterium]
MTSALHLDGSPAFGNLSGKLLIRHCWSRSQNNALEKKSTGWSSRWPRHPKILQPPKPLPNLPEHHAQYTRDRVALRSFPAGASRGSLSHFGFPDRPLGEMIPDAFRRANHDHSLPELTESDVIRHFLNLSTLNMSVDTHFYPLGSCTMKYNPKRHERMARLPGMVDLHPYQRICDQQGMLRLLHDMQEMLAEIAGLPAVSLQPAAGAQGELAALLVASAWFRSRGETRTRVIFPSSAHGTNPASAAIAGFECVQLENTSGGLVDLDELETQLDDQTAVFMITNPNTLGLFETQIESIAARVHEVGGLVYIDGANMNAIMGVTRPGDFGGDMMHFNVHKTFTGPHGAGGPRGRAHCCPQRTRRVSSRAGRHANYR